MQQVGLVSIKERFIKAKYNEKVPQNNETMKSES